MKQEKILTMMNMWKKKITTMLIVMNLILMPINKSYNVPVGRCSLNISQEKHNYLDMHSNALTCLGESNKKRNVCLMDLP